MKYDYLGRRVGKQVWEMRGQWSLLSSQTMVYDSWNLIREETTASGTGKIVDEYVWGLDLSGSLQGAGGVGGLICRKRRVERYYDGQGKLIICHHPPRNPEQPKTIRINENIWPLHEAHGDTLGACEGPDVTNSVFFYTYDGNGNVSELLQPATPSAWSSVVGPPSSVAAHYEYSPFGELIVSTGPEAADNPFRFSTKYWDSETALNYYDNRYYSSSLGRWLSRDPMGELGGLNFYGFSGNDGINNADPFGLSFCSWLNGKIRSFLSSGNDIRAWNRFVSGSQQDIQLSDDEMKSIVNSSSKFTQKRDEKKKECDDPSYPNWFAVSDNVADTIGDPWAGSIGGVSITFKSTCACRCLIWSAQIDDYYDFDIKGIPYFAGRPNGAAEAQVWMVKIAQILTFCGWKEFHHKGETFGSGGSGCKPPYTP